MIACIRTAFTLLILIISCRSFVTADGDDYPNLTTDFLRESPLIIPNEPDITLEIGSNVTIECESTEPIHWKFFENFDGNYRVHSIHTPDKRRPYGSILTLIDVNYTYVGEYICVNEDDDSKPIEDLKAEYKASEIYIFVNDSNNLLVEGTISSIQGHQYSNVIIPCKPTSKWTEVQLIKDGDESHHFPATYDATIGYTIRLLSLSDGGSFMCRAKDDPNQNEIDFHVFVISQTDYLNKPIIKSPKFATQGEELTLNCSIEVQAGVVFKFKWITPNGNLAYLEKRVEEKNPTKESHPISNSHSIGRSSITIHNLNRNDQGVYKCEVEDDSNHREHDEITVSILKKGEGAIFIKEPSNIYKIEISSTQPEARWRVKYAGYPVPKLIWYDNQGKEILIKNTSGQFDKHEVEIGDDYALLIIRSLQLADTGNYTLKAFNGITEVEKVFQLVVKDKPSVSVNNAYVMAGESTKLICECAGYPPSKITWLFTPCSIRPQWPTCDMTRSAVVTRSEYNKINTDTITSLAQRSEFIFNPTQPGFARCFAKNTEGNDSAMATVLIGDLEEPLHIWIEGQNGPTAAGDNLSVHCGALVYNFTAELNWYLDNVPVERSEILAITDTNTEYSYRKTLTWTNIRTSDSGKYECRANYINNELTESQLIDINVDEPYLPQIDITNLIDEQMKKLLGEPLRLQCKFVGIPIPQVIWYKDDMLLTTMENDTRIELVENSTILDIKFIKIEDEGEYRCEGKNKVGTTSKISTLKISNVPFVSKWLIIGIIALIVILIACTIYLCVRVRRGKRLLREMKAAGLMNFVEGNPESINPELTLDEQADLLPYDKKYEFPREKLKLGKQLGAGAFGVVVKGVAQGIIPNEDESTVAVKMVKQTADNEVMRALVTELKIMVHLGQHLNVVNLLGAVTKNIAKREVMVIVEYCRFGNVQNFLVKHRNYFVDQINPETDIIDPTILTKEQRWSNDSGYEYNRQGLKYVRLSFSNTDSNSNKPNNGKPDRGYITYPSSGNDYFPGGMDSASTEAALITTSAGGGEDNLVLSNNSVQPAWRSNYKMDYKGPLRYITTTDLICWSFQVARGMDYLSSRKVLHGDLAARNILLCDDNVVKICDFGLARSMYKNDNYKKKGEALLPFKWLAIESIGDQIFSTYSDVWSFGIVMWELFSLGKVPYPGMDADQGLYYKIKDGYRMEKPPHATRELYDIMLNCWNANPETRPVFSVLEKRLGKLLENGVAEHYIDLNEPYLQTNIDVLKTRETDYLSIMGPPEGNAPTVPIYINKDILPNPDVPDYLNMSPKTGNVIFSPRPDVDTSFSFGLSSSTNVPNKSPLSMEKSSKNKATPEEIPMLQTSKDHLSSGSEDDISPNRKWAERQFSDFKDFKPEAAVRTTINKPSDQYVNVPSAVIDMNNSYKLNDTVTNPSYVAFGQVNETRT